MKLLIVFEGELMKRWSQIIILLIITFSTTLVFAQDSETNTYVRFAHLSVDTPLVDISVNGDIIAEAVDFATVSDWMKFPTGTINVTVALNTPTNDLTQFPIMQSFTLSDDIWTTIAIMGFQGNATLTLNAIQQNMTLLANGETHLNFFHAIPDATAIDVSLNDLTIVQTLTYPGMFDNNADGFASVTVLAQPYTIAAEQNNETWFSLPQTTFGSGRSYFIIFTGTRESPQYILVETDLNTILNADANPEELVDVGEGLVKARIGHSVPGGANVDVYINGELTVSDIGFSEYSDYITLEAGYYTVELTGVGVDREQAVYTTTLPLVANQTYTISAIGTIEQNTLTVVATQENTQPIITGESRIAIIHAIPDTQFVEIIVTNVATGQETVLVQGLAYPGFLGGDGYVSVDVIANEFEIRAVVNNRRTIDLGTIDLAQSQVYTYTLTGLEASSFYILDVFALTDLLVE